MTINWQDFEAVQLRVGTVIEVSKLPKARKPAYVLHIDFGADLGVKKSSAQITDLYQAQELLGKQVIAVTNFPAKQIGSIQSECLVTGFYNQHDEVVLAVPDKPIHNGARLS